MMNFKKEMEEPFVRLETGNLSVDSSTKVNDFRNAPKSLHLERNQRQPQARSIVAFLRIHLTAVVLFTSLIMASLQTAAMKELSDAGAQNCTYTISGKRDKHAPPRRTLLATNSTGIQYLDRRLARNGRKYHRPTNILNNAVSPFNILVYGNVVIFFVMLTIYGRIEVVRSAKKLTKKQWLKYFCTILALSMGSLLYSALCQSFTYLALQETSAINVSVLTRLEPIMIMVLARVILNEKVPIHNIAAAIISLVGICMTFVYPTIFLDTDFEFGLGEIFAIIAATCVSFSSIISKTMLKEVPLGLFIIYRCFLGTILFSIIGAVLNGESNLVNPFQLCSGVWFWIFEYAGLSVLALILWFGAVKRASAQLLSLATSFGFVISLVVSYFALGEVPSEAEWVGAALIILSLLTAQIGEALKAKRERYVVLEDGRRETRIMSADGERLEICCSLGDAPHGGSETSITLLPLHNSNGEDDNNLEDTNFVDELNNLRLGIVEALEDNIGEECAPIGAGAIIRY